MFLRCAEQIDKAFEFAKLRHILIKFFKHFVRNGDYLRLFECGFCTKLGEKRDRSAHIVGVFRISLVLIALEHRIAIYTHHVAAQLFPEQNIIIECFCILTDFSGIRIDFPDILRKLCVCFKPRLVTRIYILDRPCIFGLLFTTFDQFFHIRKSPYSKIPLRQ